MISELRRESINNIEYFVGLLPQVQDILDIGIAGDVKPGGNAYLFLGKNYKTMDIVADLEPSIVQDVTTASQNANLKENFDLIIFSNTMEHVFEKEKSLEGCFHMLRPGGYLIVDIPWMYIYHTSAESDDYWRISANGLEKMLLRTGFSEVEKIQGKHCSTVLARK